MHGTVNLQGESFRLLFVNTALCLFKRLKILEMSFSGVVFCVCSFVICVLGARCAVKRSHSGTRPPLRGAMSRLGMRCHKSLICGCAPCCHFVRRRPELRLSESAWRDPPVLRMGPEPRPSRGMKMRKRRQGLRTRALWIPTSEPLQSRGS